MSAAQRLALPSLALLGLLPCGAIARDDRPAPAPAAEPLVLSLGNTHAIQVAVLQEGRTLATIGGDGKLRLWDLARGTSRGEVAVGRPTNYHNFHFLERPDGKQVVIAGHYDRAYVINLEDGKLVREFAVSTEAWPASYALADKGAALIQLDRGLHFRHYDVETGKRKEGVKLPAPPKDAETGGGAHLQLAPDGKSYAINGRTAVLRDAATHEARYTLKADDRAGANYRNGPYPPYYSADSRLVLFQGMDNSLRVVEVATGKEVRKLRLEADPSRPGVVPVIAPAAFAPNGQWVLATTDSTASELILFGVASGLEVRRFPGKVVGPSGRTIALSSRGNLLVAPGGMFHQIEVWEMETGKLRAKAVPGK
jgi:WD40 repeat protein